MTTQDEVRKNVINILRMRGSLTFDELRMALEDMGIYIDGRILRSIVASLIRAGLVTKIPDSSRRKFLLKLSVSP